MFRSESYKKGIIFSTGFNFVTKLIGFAKSIVIAYYFGTQTKTDVYFYVIATIGLFVGFVTALDHSVLIPESIRIREQESEKKAQQFLTFFLHLYLIIGIIAIGVLLINPVKVFLTVSKFNEANLANNVELLYWLIPLCVLMLITTYLTDIMASYKYFTMPMVAAIINSALSLLFVVFFHSILDLRSIVLGVTIGYLLNIALLLSIMKHRLHWLFTCKLVLLRKEVIRNVFYAQAGNISSVLVSYVPLYLLSGFNAGIITALNYGRDVSEIPNQMINSQFSVVSGIKFNELCVRKEYDKLNEYFLITTKFLIFILMPISGIFFLFSEEIITLFFKRGSFDDESVKQAALFLRYLGLSLSYFVINTMVSRLFMATQKIKQFLGYQILTNTLSISIVFLCTTLWGVMGYLAGIISSQVLIVITIYVLTNHYFKIINYKSLLKFLSLMLVVNICIIMPLEIAKEFFTSQFMCLIVGSLLYLILIVSVNMIFKFELQSISLVKSVINKCKYF
jgi:putative peptidoglycan lipid II flippase